MLRRYRFVATDRTMALLEDRMSPDEKVALRHEAATAGLEIREYLGRRLGAKDRWECCDLEEVL